MAPLVDLREFYSKNEVKAALKELQKDRAFELGKQKVTDLLRTDYPLKYLGIEPSTKRARFPLATALRIALRPRSMDGASEGLRLSVHRKAFIERFPDVDAALNARALFDAAPKSPLTSLDAFGGSTYAKLAKPALERLHELTDIPVETALRVLRKGLAAYRSGHRPGMSAHGWARARLTSFTMKGCTHFFPDHQLALACGAKTQKMWRDMPCLCRKRAQCDRYGTRTRANSR